MNRNGQNRNGNQAVAAVPDQGLPVHPAASHGGAANKKVPPAVSSTSESRRRGRFLEEELENVFKLRSKKIGFRF